MTIYREVHTQTGITKTRLPEFDYSINPYFGCEFSCIYCYAVKYFLIKGYKERWGELVEVKVNLPALVKKEINKIKYGASIGIGISTDPYQPAENKYQITKKILEELSIRDDVSISIQTKSPFILRDLKIIKKLGNIDVGFTITTLDDDLAKILEPYSPLPKSRIRALSILSNANIDTWVFIGPILPYLTDDEKNLSDIVKYSADAGVNRIYADNLRFRLGVRENIIKGLSNYLDKSITNKYKELKYDELIIRYKRAVDYLQKEAKKYKIYFVNVGYLPKAAKYKPLL